MNQTTLFRYNFRVMMMNNWLLLAFPLAVSQLTVFWLVLTRRSSVEIPAQSVEIVSPILAAFLGAHLLSAEYRSRVGAILASRPVNISRIIVTRLLAMLGLVWSLALLSLLAFNAMMEKFDLLPSILACVPSTLFLSLLALTFATLFRNSLAGFSVAALYWIFDLAPGAPIMPYLSLRSLSAYYAVELNPPHQTFLQQWWIAKCVLLVGAALLYIYHNRIVLSIGSPLTSSGRRRAAVAAGFIVIAYMMSGAVMKVSYGYTHRGSLPRGDLAWFRYQMSSFGPLPVSSLFGRPFRAYIGDIGNPWRMNGEDDTDLLGNTVDHLQLMHAVLDRSGDSIWAPSIYDGLAEMEARKQSGTDQIVAYYRAEAARYPNSPYCQNALREIGRTLADAGKDAEARGVYEELLKRFPETHHRSECYRFLYLSEQAASNRPQALNWAEKWSALAPIHEKFEALMYVAQLRQAGGDTAGAKQAAEACLAAADELEKAIQEQKVALTPAQANTRKVKAQEARKSMREIISGTARP